MEKLSDALTALAAVGISELLFVGGMWAMFPNLF